MSYSKIKEFIPIFNSMATTLVKKIKETKEEFIDINEELTLLTFDVIGKAGFGYDFGSLSGNKSEKLENIKKVLSSFFNFYSIIFKSYYDDLPLQKNKEMKEICEKVDKWIESVIEERREERKNTKEQKISNKDLLDLILEAEYEENVKLSTKELQNNIFLFFFAGHGIYQIFVFFFKLFF